MNQDDDSNEEEIWKNKKEEAKKKIALRNRNSSTRSEARRFSITSTPKALSHNPSTPRSPLIHTPYSIPDLPKLDTLDFEESANNSIQVNHSSPILSPSVDLLCIVEKDNGHSFQSDGEQSILSSSSTSEHSGFSSVESILRRAPFFNRSLIIEMDQINLSFCRLTSVPHDLSLFTKLRTLCLSNNSIRSLEAMRIVESCPLLIKLDLSRNCINNVTELRDIGHLQHLEELDFRFNPIPILDNRVAIIQALLFFHPFKPYFSHPDTQLNQMATPAPQEQIPPVSSSPTENSFFKQSKKKSLKVRAKYMFGDSTLQRSQDSRHISDKLKKQTSNPTVSPQECTTRAQSSPSPVDSKVPRFMTPTASSLRHMTVSGTSKEEKNGTTATLTHSDNSPEPSIRLSALQKLRKAKTIIHVFSAMKGKKHAHNSLPLTPYLAYVEQQEKMNRFMEDFEMSEMGPFLESIEDLHRVLEDPKAIIEKTKLCSVPRSYNSPFPMLKVINGKIMTVGEYMLAENEEIYDICAHHNRELGRKFTLRVPSSLNGKRKKLKFKMEFGNELLEKDFQDMEIEECMSSDEEELSGDSGIQHGEQEDHDNFLERENKQQFVNRSKSMNFDAEHLLNAIKTSKRDPIDLKSIGECFGVLVDDSNPEFLPLNEAKWKSIQNLLPDPISITFSETVRRGFKKNKILSDRVLGIESKKKYIDFRPFKQQILDLSYDEVITRMRRTELKQNVEQWADTVDFLKNVEIDHSGAKGEESDTKGALRLSDKLVQRMEEKKKREAKMKGIILQKEDDIYLENDEVSKFFHDQRLELKKNSKQKEKEDSNWYKKEMKMSLSNKSLHRPMITTHVALPDAGNNLELITLDRLLV